jgi:hypothetical protein
LAKAVVAQRHLAAIHRDQLEPRVIGVALAAGAVKLTLRQGTQPDTQVRDKINK